MEDTSDKSPRLVKCCSFSVYATFKSSSLKAHNTPKFGWVVGSGSRSTDCALNLLSSCRGKIFGLLEIQFLS